MSKISQTYPFCSDITDYFGVNCCGLKEKRLFLFDMDGTIYEEETLFDGTLDLLKQIIEMGGRYVFITNNSSKSVTDYIEKVTRLGIKVTKDNFFTSSQATVLYIRKNYPKIKIYCQGTESLIKELKDSGLDVVTKVSMEAGLVLVGFDTELTSAKLKNTCEMLQRDIPFLATNPDLACPVRFGFIPDCGSICQMLENVTGRKPVYIGKPKATMLDIVRKKFHYSKAQTVVIGDRLYTDIAAGINAGVTSICVLTGEATADQIVNGTIKPDYTFESVKNIYLAIS